MISHKHFRREFKKLEKCNHYVQNIIDRGFLNAELDIMSISRNGKTTMRVLTKCIIPKMTSNVQQDLLKKFRECNF